MSSPADHDPVERVAGKAPAVASPSSSVLIISPENTVLMVHRVQTSSAFPSGNVFPGGHLDAYHDGAIPGMDHPERHSDCEAYRLGAIRETFEESGILLAKDADGRLLSVPEAVREQGRKDMYEHRVRFRDWVAIQGGVVDLDGLMPFTRWITPKRLPRRFTTQMYLYFLPLEGSWEGGTSKTVMIGAEAAVREIVIPHPTHDGGKEHTAAKFNAVGTWVSMFERREVLLFPPQFYLLSHLAMFLNPVGYDGKKASRAELRAQRERLVEFLESEDEFPKWADKTISPVQLEDTKNGGVILLLDKSSYELKHTSRRGDLKRVICTKTSLDYKSWRELKLRMRDEIMNEGEPIPKI